MNSKSTHSKKQKTTPKVQNTFKSPAKSSTAKGGNQKKSTQSESKPRKNVNIIKKITSNESRIGFGLFILVFSLFATVACFSYLRNWKIDDNVISGGFASIFDSDTTVNNSMGKMGAWVASVFIKKWFGLGSFFLIIFLFNSGLLLLKVKLLSLKDSVIYLLGLTVWFSIFMAAVFSSTEVMIWGGLFGNQIKEWIYAVIGGFGLYAIIFIVFFAYIISIFNIKLKDVKIPAKKENDGEDVPENIINKEPSNVVSAANVEIDPQAKLEPELEPEIKIKSNIEVQPEPEIVIEVKSPQKPLENSFEGEKYETNHAEKPENTDLSHGDEIVLTPVEQPKPQPKKQDEIAFTVEHYEPTTPVVESPVDSANGDDEEPSTTTEHYGLDTIYDPHLELRDFQMPTADLLVEHSSGKPKVSRDELEKNKNRIVETLGYYDIKISEIKATIGPTVTMYEIVPAPGIRISKIKNLEDDIALSLSALGIRIIAPIPGKGTIGIEVPNENGEIVSMRSMVESEKFINSKYELPFAIGKTITNEVFVADLAKLPHLLIAGATGQGKSVGLNAIICSLLYHKHPSELKFVLVDPKKVELALYAKIEKHYLAKIPGESESIITDVTKAVGALNSLTKLMDSRYDLLKIGGAKNIIEYNNKFINRRLNPENGHHFMPYIVVVVDEFADLIMQVGREVELPVARIAQLARAVGIHLIIATQRPSVDVITGKIKANFPARIAFKVAQKVDSRTILDGNGADQLIGRGDMLYSHGSVVHRIQCAFIDTPEIEALTEFIGNQRGYSDALELPEYTSESTADAGKADTNNLDKLFKDAARLVVASQQGSTSMLQTKLTIGFARARRIIDQLENLGIVGMQQGSKPREVLIHDLQSLEQFLENLN